VCERVWVRVRMRMGVGVGVLEVGSRLAGQAVARSSQLRGGSSDGSPVRESTEREPSPN
jgi:hypothetical protein